MLRVAFNGVNPIESNSLQVQLTAENVQPVAQTKQSNAAADAVIFLGNTYLTRSIVADG